METKKYDNLYLDILKIGRTKIEDGLSYEILKGILIKKGYDFSCDCIELAVKQWFYDSFHHKTDDELVSISDLDNHLECNFIMKGDACLKLISYETSKRNIGIAFISLTISMIVVFLSIFHF